MFKVATDHRGRVLKERVMNILDKLGILYEDLSPKNTSSDDYPDFAKKVCESLKEDEFGFLACGTGIGMSIAANRHSNVRGALVSNKEDVFLSRKDDNANVLILGGNKSYSDEELEEFFRLFVETKFEKGRHERRVNKIK